MIFPLNGFVSFIVSCFFISITFAQPPAQTGTGADFLTPLTPPIEDLPAAQVLSTPLPASSPISASSPIATSSPIAVFLPIIASPPSPASSPIPEPLRSSCESRPCRVSNGECTAIENPIWGQARFAQFSYMEDSSSEIPSGQTLKSAREISNILSTQDADIPNEHGLNQLFVFFGQFLDHNLVATPVDVGASLDINVPQPDPHLTQTSLPFKRSLRGATGIGMNTRPINILTSAIDLAAVYAPNDLRNTELLEFDLSGSLTGKLKTSGDDLLPLNVNGYVNAPDTSSAFFLAGDHRSNEHPVLTSLHTIFLREHNRLCDKIKERIPSLPSRMVYEYARKINSAQYQKIVYEEFYPAIIRKKLPRYFGPRREANPTVSDIFGGAAFRIGHTMVANDIPRRGPTDPLPPLETAASFFRPASSFSSSEVDNLIRGTANSLSQEVDLKVVDALRNMLFENIGGEEGPDLVALNIQRGRDHALPKYTKIRDLFFLPTLTSFEEISSDPQTVYALKTAYDNNIDDVEAFVGLIAEDHLPRSGVGPTMAAVWEAEFTRLRDGDQFFYKLRNKFPRLLRRRLRDCLKDLKRKRKKIFRDIIIRNTGITADQLPSGNIFKSYSYSY